MSVQLISMDTITIAGRSQMRYSTTQNSRFINKTHLLELINTTEPQRSFDDSAG